MPKTLWKLLRDREGKIKVELTVEYANLEDYEDGFIELDNIARSYGEITKTEVFIEDLD